MGIQCNYCMTPNILANQNIFFNHSKIQIKTIYQRVLLQKDVNQNGNSEDTDQTAPLIAV